MRLEQFTQIDPEVGDTIFKTHGLTYLERETVRLLFGLCGGYRKTREEITQYLGVSIDQVRLLEANAARKLKDVIV
ncbi:MAG: hypothetical protein KDA84_08340 [Planctomycetaceae bacterium]|nr:hypothetical protein [Planctomycetaceae bacterium]